MSTIIATSTITNSNSAGASFVPTGDFFVVCSAGNVRLEVQIASLWYGVAFANGDYSKVPQIKRGTLVNITRLEAGATYRLIGDPTIPTTASAYNL